MQKHTERERERQRERERKRECERCVEEEEDDERGGGGGIDSILHTDRDRRHFDSDARFVRFDFLLFCFCFCLFVCLFVCLFFLVWWSVSIFRSRSPRKLPAVVVVLLSRRAVTTTKKAESAFPIAP